MATLHRFFAATFKPFFFMHRIGDCTRGLYAFFPEWSIRQLAQLKFKQDYTIIVQHWGIMVGLMGLFMMGAAIGRRGVYLFWFSAPSRRRLWCGWSCHMPIKIFVRGFWIPALQSMRRLSSTQSHYFSVGWDIAKRCNACRASELAESI